MKFVDETGVIAVEPTIGYSVLNYINHAVFALHLKASRKNC